MRSAISFDPTGAGSHPPHFSTGDNHDRAHLRSHRRLGFDWAYVCLAPRGVDFRLIAGKGMELMPGRNPGHLHLGMGQRRALSGP